MTKRQNQFLDFTLKLSCFFWVPKLPVNDLSGSTIQRQRREIQLLMEELKDREVELNAMATSHHKQHQVWEQDRQTVRMLEQRCARLHGEGSNSTPTSSCLYCLLGRSANRR